MSNEQAITEVMDIYFEALRTNNSARFMDAFHATATVTHAAVKKGTVSTLSITEFVEQMEGIHAKFGGIVETPLKMQIDIAEPVAGVRVDYSITLGTDITLTGTDFFSLAQEQGRWYITSKLYSM